MSRMAATDGFDSIAAITEKRSERRQVFDQTLELIDRAGDKYRDDKQNRRKWNRVLIRLEDSLVEAKKAVDECDTLLEIEQRRTEEPTEKPAEPHVSEQVEPESPVVESDPEKRAAYEIADAPIEKLSSISLQDVAFARAYTARRSFAAHDKEFRKRLSARIELASQLPGVQRATKDQGERRRQSVLRDAIVKVQQGQIESMSDEEIDLVVGCYRILSGKLISNAENTRLLEIISGMIEVLRAERSRRHLSSR